MSIVLNYSDLVGQPRITVRPQVRSPRKSDSVSGYVGGAAAVGISYAVGGAMLTNPKTAPIGIMIFTVPDVAIFAAGYKIGDMF